MTRGTAFPAFVVSILCVGGCAQFESPLPGVERDTAATAATVLPGHAPYESTYRPPRSRDVALLGATVLDGTGRRFEDATVVIVDGRIAAVGSSAPIPDDTQVIDATGKWITPGIIDAHSHLGAYPLPRVDAHNDGNETTAPLSAEVWVEHSVFPQDPAFSRARAGGVTTVHILPGSTNLFGGRTVVLKNVSSTTVQGMKFPGAAQGLKMACGENPKHVYGARGKAPVTRMKSFAMYRAAWERAVAYRSGRQIPDGPMEPDGELETLSAALAGDLAVHVHCYRADDLARILDLAHEFGFRIASFEHAVEAYKILPLIVDSGSCVSSSPDLWGYKMETYDSIRENLALVHEAGGCAIVHSDSEVAIQHLNHSAAKVLFAARNAGLSISRAEAWQWLSLNPARLLGIDDETGSLEPGMAADVVLWSTDPFSVYAKAEKVFIDGALVYDSAGEGTPAGSDFDTGRLTHTAQP